MAEEDQKVEEEEEEEKAPRFDDDTRLLQCEGISDREIERRLKQISKKGKNSGTGLSVEDVNRTL